LNNIRLSKTKVEEVAVAYISIVLPFYNEEQTLPLLISSLRETMSQVEVGYELVLVNDNSTDNSVKVIEGLAKRQGRGDIVLVNLSRRFGVEESFVAGLSVSRGDALVLMYTDLQDPPKVILEMIKQWRGGAEVVHAIRRKRIGEHPLKKLAAFLAYRIVAKAASINIPCDAGEFKLLSRNVVQHLLSLPEAEPYLRGLIPWIGFKQVCVEYDLQPRPVGHSKVALFGKKAWSVFLSGIISFSDLPVYLILFAGVVGIGLSIILGVMDLLSGGTSGIDPLATLLVFLWATLMLSLGFVGLYLLKVYKNTVGRPRYIIKEVVKFDEV